jgi:hypothetical protein
MEDNAISRRGFLKEAGLAALLGLGVATGIGSAGCATYNHNQTASVQYSTESTQALQRYNSISPYHLTAQQKEDVTKFDANVAEFYKEQGVNSFPQETKDWLKEKYPFIDLDFKPKDKAFLMQEMDGAFDWIGKYTLK